MIWGLLIGTLGLIGFVIAFVLLRYRNEAAAKTPAALANQVLRYPERILLDVPLYIPASMGTEAYNFLLETEAELASTGEQGVRRRFLNHLAEVIREPSKSQLKELTDFLFHVAPEEFRQTLLWDGRCGAAIQFLESLDNFVKSVDEGRRLDDIRRDFKKIKKKRKSKMISKESDLRDGYKDIIQEWIELNHAFYETVMSPGKKSRISHIKGRVSHLIFFQKVADEVYKSIFKMT